MQKPHIYSFDDLDLELSILEESENPSIPHWHKLIVAERLRIRNQSTSLDIPWEDVILRLKNQHDIL
jgi:hypothetical protein